ncbi:MAG: hypothetical protein KGJ86_10400 [Chloroflexota bacterium]|nr:hypothetical protein [Chloroflexota bacterium]
MALLPYPDYEQLSPEAKAEIDRFEQIHGRQSLYRRMLAWYPPLLKVADAMYPYLLENGRLPWKLKEVLRVAAGHQRGSFY